MSARKTSLTDKQTKNGTSKYVLERCASVNEYYDIVFKVMLLGDSSVGKTCLLVRFKDGAFLGGNFIATVGIDFRNKVVDVDNLKVKLQTVVIISARCTCCSLQDELGSPHLSSLAVEDDCKEVPPMAEAARVSIPFTVVPTVHSLQLLSNQLLRFNSLMVRFCVCRSSQWLARMAQVCEFPRFSHCVIIRFDPQIWDTAGQERFRSVTHAYYRDAQALLLLYDVTSKTSFDNIRAWLTEIHEYAQKEVVIMLLGNKSDMAAERAVKTEEGEKLAKEYGVPFMETSAKTGVNVELAFLAIAKELKHRTTQQPNEPKFQIHDYIESQRQKTACCGLK
ncbi:Ras-related protein [Takifugu flavidus]|uniref:small monomeric GTPase n=1 Tax=Takifugu flavidus TaxID=433684 RepID=A0A5C6NS67_9TELE|nr:Ras-related protein [Takifugu flavidus]